MADQVAAAAPDWTRYYTATLGREPRPLLRAACELLGPGAGRIAIDLGCGSGIHDSWAATSPHMTFHSPGQVRDLLDGLEVMQLDETERDGAAVSGPKHWHVYEILARAPR